jgi:hypothetical protein
MLFASVIGAAVACGGGDGGSGPSESEITGTWQLTKLQYVNAASPQESVDLIALGATGTLIIDPNKTYTMTLTPPVGPPETETGAWDLAGDVFAATPTGMPFDLQFDVTITGNTLRLAGADSEYDFDDDATVEAAKLTIEGTK